MRGTQDQTLVYGALDKTRGVYESEQIQKSVPKVALYFHRLIVKPIGHYWSSKILRTEIEKAVGEINGKTVIDVSSGDDPTIIKLASHAKWVVANDVSLYSMVPLILRNPYDNVVFTSQNLLNLNYEKADVVICKNTLHHLKNLDQIVRALHNLKELGKKIVIMDVEDPQKKLHSKIWNYYYRFLLKDQGDFFLDYKEFKNVIKKIYKGRKINLKKIGTVKGTYLLAKVE